MPIFTSKRVTSVSDRDAQLLDADPDPAKLHRSDRIRIHSTAKNTNKRIKNILNGAYYHGF
jgi:hypothetical protein